MAETGGGGRGGETGPQGAIEEAGGVAGPPIDAEFEAIEEAPGRGSRVGSWRLMAGVIVAALAVGAVGSLMLFRGPAGEDAAGTGDQARAIAELSARVDRLAARPVADASGEAGAAVAALSAEMDALRGGLQATGDRLDALATTAASGAGEPGPALGAITQRLSALEAAPGAQSSEIAALGARVDALSQAVAAQRAAVDELSQAMSDLAIRLTGVRASAGTGGVGAAAALAFADLDEATGDGRGFTAEIDAAAPYFSEDASFEALRAYADMGAPTLGDLTVGFRAAARAATRAEAGSPGGVFEQVGRAVGGVVTVRRPEAALADGTSDVLERAQARLDRADLAGAIGEARRLTGPAGEAVAEWIAAAERRLEVDRAVDELRLRVIGG
ncbi:MAG: hypothetical protein MI723_02600 [Caulobacterales bacterium]|nr:hypothetical protein [Caulobacterales bacterium]